VAGSRSAGKPVRRPMKWMLVVLVGGVTPVNTDLVFDKFSDGLSAEEQMRQHYADAFETWDRWATANFDRRRPGQAIVEQRRNVCPARRTRPGTRHDAQQPAAKPSPQPTPDQAGR